jgi:hypothetical protein
MNLKSAVLSAFLALLVPGLVQADLLRSGANRLPAGTEACHSAQTAPRQMYHMQNLLVSDATPL